MGQHVREIPPLPPVLVGQREPRGAEAKWGGGGVKAEHTATKKPRFNNTKKPFYKICSVKKS